MKNRMHCCLTGLIVSVLLAGSASAGYTGIVVVEKPNEFGILTCNVYAQFDGADATDLVNSVFGGVDASIDIEVIDGTFYQHDFGGDLPPTCELINRFPALAYDTFVTIGKKCDDTATILLPGWPGFEDSLLHIEDGGWAVVPDQDQAFPDENNRVLLGQFSTLDGSGVQGTFGIQVRSNGTTIQVTESFSCGGEEPAIPTVSEWGMIVMTLVLLTAGAIVLGRRRQVSMAA